MKKITFILTFLSASNFYAQSAFNSKSVDVTYNDLETNTFERDSTANALVIYDFGNSYVDQEDFELKTEIKRKVKILNKEGFHKANITLYLYSNEKRAERIKNIVATTYNYIDGNLVKTELGKKQIFEEKYDDNHTLIKFALPNIKEGSVITYSYTLSTPFIFNYRGWNFQEDIPKLYSEYRASIPGNYDYNIKLIGGRKLTLNTNAVEKDCLKAFNGGVAHCGKYVYAMEDIPAFIEEEYMTSKSNYLARVEYELKTYKSFTGGTDNYTKTWETVDDELKRDANIGKQLSKSVDTESLLSAEILNEPDTFKKAQRIYSFVQENYTWNEEFKIFKDVSVKDLIKNKSGNVSAINILLHNLLQAAGIAVKPVLLSTRNNGFATKIFPVISEFNYLLVQATINGKNYLLDATDKYLSFGTIPFRCLNNYARVLDFKNGSDWFDIAYENIITGDNIYLNPFLIKFFNENPFKVQERTYPIDFGYKDSYYYSLRLHFNEDLALLEIPKSTALSLPNDAGRLIFSSNVINSTLDISFRINFKEAVYQPEYYPYLKEFMNKIVDIQNNSLILLKKK